MSDRYYYQVMLVAEDAIKAGMDYLPYRTDLMALNEDSVVRAFDNAEEKICKGLDMVRQARKELEIRLLGRLADDDDYLENL